MVSLGNAGCSSIAAFWDGEDGGMSRVSSSRALGSYFAGDRNH